MSSKIKVLIVDDSAVVRAKLAEILATDQDLEVIGTASDPFIAVQRMEEVTPDVMTLDLEMPRMDGLTFLEKIMSQHPIPVVICSSMADVNSDNFIKALSLGAVDILHKPKIGTKQFLEESRVQICDTVKGAAKAKVISRTMQVAPKLSADAVLAKAKPFSTFQTTEKIIVIGASTGGTEALRYLLPQFPRDCPGIVVVQHMPELFTRSFAKSLNDMSSIEVKEAQDNDTILRGQALIAPGGSSHLMVKRSGARYFVEIKEGPLVNRHRPSVDVMFRSAARYAGPNTIGLLLTGMGDDGAAGLLEILQAGGKTFAQDEASSVVFGMPRVAIEMGAAEKIVSLTEATQKILQGCY